MNFDTHSVTKIKFFDLKCWSDNDGFAQIQA